MSKKDNFSIYLSYLLRHHPDDAKLDMDNRGFVSVEQLINNINEIGKYNISFEELEKVVAEDNKGRYRFNEEKTKIKACQGHSLDFVEPELEFVEPPEFLYHGTTTEALAKIKKSGEINKMSRHAVHMQANIDKAWQSAKRWKKIPVVLKIAASKLAKTGVVFGKTENNVWCAEKIPVEYIVEEVLNEH